MNQFICILRAWIRGEEAELHIDKIFHFGWLEVGAMLVTFSLILVILLR